MRADKLSDVKSLLIRKMFYNSPCGHRQLTKETWNHNFIDWYEPISRFFKASAAFSTLNKKNKQKSRLTCWLLRSDEMDNWAVKASEIFWRVMQKKMESSWKRFIEISSGVFKVQASLLN